MTETMLVLSFLMLMLMGTITLCLLMTTKQVADYAAFGAARTSLVWGFQQTGIELPLDLSWIVDVPAGASAQTGWPSAAQVIYHTQHWWDNEASNFPWFLRLEQPDPSGPQYVVVPYYVPYGMPIFNELPAGGLLIEGRSPIVQQPNDLIWKPF